MIEQTSLNELKDKFATASTLPQLPGAALKLIQILDHDDVNGAEVERIIMGDPALTAAVIRAASSAVYGSMDAVTTVRGAITRLGHRSVQSVAVSLGVQSLMGQGSSTPSFDRTRFARHSIFVGFLGRYLYACRYNKESFKSKWTRDEIFAAGVLHDMGVGLLAKVDAHVYEHVFQVAKKSEISLQHAFASIFGESINCLGSIAAKTWNLPPLFSEVLCHYERPELHESELIALGCLNYANYLADDNNHSMTSWKFAEPSGEAVLAEVGVSDEEVPNIVMLVSRHTAAYVPLTRAA